MKKGVTTKEKILEVSKTLFYENGYKNTKLSDIADAAGVIKGNIFYYFKKKDDIVNTIYNDTTEMIYEYLRSVEDVDYLRFFCRYSVLLYEMIFKDEKNKRFYFEIIHNKSNYRVLSEIARKDYQNVIDTVGIKMNDVDFEILLLSEFGSRREIFLYYSEKGHGIDLDILISHLIRNFFNAIQYPPERIDALIIDAFKFRSQASCEHIKFLV